MERQNKMEYVRRLIQETDYLKQMEQLEELETKRIFCRHGLNHVLDVARIAWVQVLEEKLPYEKEDIYLTALLHDMGRILEYREGIPHHEAGQKMAEVFLEQIGYPKEKGMQILTAIGEHRNKNKLNDDFINVINRADTISRNCFFCKASGECKWSEERKNKTIIR